MQRACRNASRPRSDGSSGSPSLSFSCTGTASSGGRSLRTPTHSATASIGCCTGDRGLAPLKHEARTYFAIRASASIGDLKASLACACWIGWDCLAMNCVARRLVKVCLPFLIRLRVSLFASIGDLRPWQKARALENVRTRCHCICSALPCLPRHASAGNSLSQSTKSTNLCARTAHAFNLELVAECQITITRWSGCALLQPVCPCRRRLELAVLAL